MRDESWVVRENNSYLEFIVHLINSVKDPDADHHLNRVHSREANKTTCTHFKLYPSLINTLENLLDTLLLVFVV